MKKLNVVALLLFFAALVAVFTLKTPQTRAIQTTVMNVLSPFIRMGSHTEHQVQQIVTNPVDVARIQQENESLRREMNRLLIFEQKYHLMLEENNKFRSMLGYRQQSAIKLTAARVLRRSAANWWTTVIIDKGALDGIGTDSPVITEAGLVGKTGKVAERTAEVILLTDEECRVAARIEGTQAKGILSGERGGFETRPNLRLRFLDRTLKIEPGANIYSSGDGGVFPAGVALGKVKAFELKDISGEAVVDAAVNFGLLEDVFVVHMDSPVSP
jgi:rod shape-determining protein MreC